MAFIYNIKTTVTTECLNNDVIKVCLNDPLHYIVKDKLDDLKKEITTLNGPEEKTNKPLSKMKVDELKAFAGELGIEDFDSLNKEELLAVIKEKQNEQPE